MRTATKLRLLGIAAALVSAPAFAAGSPVPSFNDAPELYGQQQPARGGWVTGANVTPHPYPSMNDASELHPDRNAPASVGRSLPPLKGAATPGIFPAPSFNDFREVYR